MQYTNRKKYQFDKKWHLLNIYYEDDWEDNIMYTSQLISTQYLFKQKHVITYPA